MEEFERLLRAHLPAPLIFTGVAIPAQVCRVPPGTR